MAVARCLAAAAAAASLRCSRWRPRDGHRASFAATGLRSFASTSAPGAADHAPASIIDKPSPSPSPRCSRWRPRDGHRASFAATGLRSFASTSAPGAADYSPARIIDSPSPSPSPSPGDPAAGKARNTLSTLFSSARTKDGARARPSTATTQAPSASSSTAPAKPATALTPAPTAAKVPLVNPSADKLAFLFKSNAPTAPFSNHPCINEVQPTSAQLRPLPKQPEDARYLEVFSHEEIYDPVDFVKKYPFLVYVHPVGALDDKFDKWTYPELSKELARSLPKNLNKLHAKGIAFEPFGLKDLVIAADLTDPTDISARFIIRVPTKTACAQSMAQNFRDSGLAIQDLMKASVGNSDYFSALAEDIKSSLADLKNPQLNERYILENDPCYLPLPSSSNAFIKCFELIRRSHIPEPALTNILDGLPYKNGAWKAIMSLNTILGRAYAFRRYDTDGQELQVDWRRNTVSHKTKLGDWFPPEAVDITLQFYMHDFMKKLMRALHKENMLLPLKLHLLFKR